MKELNVQQMEELSAGSFWACLGGIATCIGAVACAASAAEPVGAAYATLCISAAVAGVAGVADGC